MLKKIFISRKVKPNSPLRHMLPASSFELHGESLIQFTPIPFDHLPDTDWIFFYSSNGVRYFFEGLLQNKLTLHSEIKFGAIGGGTAATLKLFVNQAHFIGSGDPVATSQKFNAEVKGKSILFIRALQSKKSIQKMLGPDVTICDLPVYRNEVRVKFELPTCDVIVLTSSLNAEAYFEKYSWNANQMVVAIGQPTAVTIRKVTDKDPLIPSEPSEEAIAQLILRLYSQ